MLTWALKRYLGAVARRVLGSMERPREAQDLAFQRIRRLLSGTRIAARTGFAECRSLDDCRKLPVSDAGSLRSLLDDVFERGEAAGPVFGRSKLLAIARTSGTLGEPKHLPIHRAYLASLDRTLRSMIATQLYTASDWEFLLTGRHLMLGSRPRCGTSPAGLPIFDVSGLAATRTWWPARRLTLPRHRDLFIEDWPAKAERILEQAKGQRVVSISGIPALATDLARRACEKYRVGHLDEAWPELKIFVYGGVHLSPDARAEIRRKWFREGRPLRFYETYFASEAPIAFAFDADREGLALNSLENLFLFRDAADGCFRLADELREGASYLVHVTTPGGLVNCAMGDRIEVVSRRPLSIRFAGREADELSMTGEKITLAQIDLALAAAGLTAARLGLQLPAVWIEGGDRPHLEWAVPDLGPISADAGWAARLDEALCRVNPLYAEALLREKVIAASRVVFVPLAAFERYRDSRLGRGQRKPRRLFKSRAEFSAAYGWSETPS